MREVAEGRCSHKSSDMQGWKAQKEGELEVNATQKEAGVGEQTTALLIPAACRNIRFYMIFTHGEGHAVKVLDSPNYFLS